MERIRHVCPGDEECLAYVQTESWKAAFREIVPAEILVECTAFEPAVAMYRRLLSEGFGNGYLLEPDGKAHCNASVLMLGQKMHCMALWGAYRGENHPDWAELICIHPLPENWRKGCGRAMMERVLADVKKAGYETLVLWVFEKNTRAIRFYESFGFVPSGKKRPSLGAVEEMYCKAL